MARKTKEFAKNGKKPKGAFKKSGKPKTQYQIDRDRAKGGNHGTIIS